MIAIDDGAAAVTHPLHTPRYGLAVPFAEGIDPDPGDAIPVFHRFIQNGAVDGLLIDVADYKHVKEGPGVWLIGHEGHYGIDLAPPRPSLVRVLRRDVPVEPEARFDALVDSLLGAVAAVEAEETLGWRFDRSTFRFWVDDRLVARADEASWRRAAPTLEAWTTRRFGPVRLERIADSARPLATWVRLDRPLDVGERRRPAA